MTTFNFTIAAIILMGSIILGIAFAMLAYYGSVRKIGAAWSIGLISMYGSAAVFSITAYAMIAVAIIKIINLIIQGLQ